jgi:hypothetical protein
MHDDQPPAPPALRFRRGARERLREALHNLAEQRATILAHRETNWASITFAGARHRLDLTFEGAEAVIAGETFIALLPEHEFSIPRQIVAEATVVAVDHQLDPPRMAVTCEVLMLEDQ